MHKVSLVVINHLPFVRCVPLMRAILRQTQLPTEVILVNSGSDVSMGGPLEEIESAYAVLAVRFKALFLESLLLPGAARNRGLEDVKERWVAFLDIDTIPDPNWLEYQLGLISHFGLTGSLGSTSYHATSFASKLIRDSIYGRLPIETLPGSVFSVDALLKVGCFIPTVRAAEDTEWLLRFHLMDLNCQRERERERRPSLVTYVGLDYLGFAEILRKWRRNYLSSRRLQHLKVQSLLVWFVLYVIASLAAFNWNAIVAGWQLDSPYYIDHVTKIVSLTPLFFYIALRGFYIPFKRGVPVAALLPFRFLLLSGVGFLLDVTKVMTILVPDYEVSSVGKKG